MNCDFWPSLASWATISFVAETLPNSSTRTLAVGGLGGGDGGERLVDELLDVLVRAGHREVDDDRAAVLGDGVGASGGIERALDLGDALDCLAAGSTTSVTAAVT